MIAFEFVKIYRKGVLLIVIVHIQLFEYWVEEVYIQKYANGKFEVRNEFFRQYIPEMLKMYDVSAMWSTWIHSVLFQILTNI